MWNGADAAQFPEKEYINGIFVAVQKPKAIIGQQMRGQHE
jgi:hypothetical protein